MSNRSGVSTSPDTDTRPQELQNVGGLTPLGCPKCRYLVRQVRHRLRQRVRGPTHGASTTGHVSTSPDTDTEPFRVFDASAHCGTQPHRVQMVCMLCHQMLAGYGKLAGASRFTDRSRSAPQPKRMPKRAGPSSRRTSRAFETQVFKSGPLRKVPRAPHLDHLNPEWAHPHGHVKFFDSAATRGISACRLRQLHMLVAVTASFLCMHPHVTREHVAPQLHGATDTAALAAGLYTQPRSQVTPGGFTPCESHGCVRSGLALSARLGHGDRTSARTCPQAHCLVHGYACSTCFSGSCASCAHAAGLHLSYLCPAGTVCVAGACHLMKPPGTACTASTTSG